MPYRVSNCFCTLINIGNSFQNVAELRCKKDSVFALIPHNVDVNQLMRQYNEYYEHIIWAAAVMWLISAIISGVFLVAMYGLAKQVCTAIPRFLNAKESVAEDEFRQRQVWQTPAK